MKNRLLAPCAVQTPPGRTEGTVLWALVALALVLSGIQPADRLTWVLETIWVMAALPILAFSWRKVQLTRLLCWLLALHALVLLYGGHYTYAETPLGFWLRDLLGFERNPWDRVGHLMQGFVPAILARELLLRFSPLKTGALLAYLVASICLAFSAFFELLEWWAALLLGTDADAFLATQGDIWDTQWDMFLCLLGAMLAQGLLSKTHNRQIGMAMSATPSSATAS